MPYDRANLHRSEEIVLDTHPHWIMLAKSVLALVASTAIGIFLLTRSWDNVFATALKWAAMLLILGTLAWTIHKFIKWYSTNFVLTTDRCIYRSGILSKRGIEIPLDRINTVFFHQRLFERLVRAGDLTIESAGELGMQRFEDVRDHVAVQNILYQAMEDNENRKFDRVRAPAAPTHAAAPMSVADEIAKLAALRDQGHITPAEFESQKAVLLGQGAPAPGPGTPPVQPPPAPPAPPGSV